jgi:hypothetical protein
LTCLRKHDGVQVNLYFPELLRAYEGMLSRWSRFCLQSPAPTNPHWPRVLYGVSLSIRKICAAAKRTLIYRYLLIRSTARHAIRLNSQFDISAIALVIRAVQSTKCIVWRAVDRTCFLTTENKSFFYFYCTIVTLRELTTQFNLNRHS